MPSFETGPNIFNSLLFHSSLPGMIRSCRQFFNISYEFFASKCWYISIVIALSLFFVFVFFLTYPSGVMCWLFEVMDQPGGNYWRETHMFAPFSPPKQCCPNIADWLISTIKFDKTHTTSVSWCLWRRGISFCMIKQLWF